MADKFSWMRRCLTVILLGSNVAVAADDPEGKQLFGQPVTLAPFTLTLSEPDRLIELTGIVERPDGQFWVTGYSENLDSDIGAGLLLLVGQDGEIVDRHDYVLDDGGPTQLWWPVLLDDGRTALAVTLRPFSETRNGGVAIVDADGALVDHVLLTDLGYPGGEISHVAVRHDGDLTATGSIAATADIDHGMVARFSTDLDLRWLSTDQARDRDFSLSGYVSAPLPDGGTIAIGTATSSDFEESYGWLAHFDDQGMLTWRNWLSGGLFAVVGDVAANYGNWVATMPNDEVAYVQSLHDLVGHTTGSVLGWANAVGLTRQIPMAPVAQAGLYVVTSAQNGDILAAGQRGDDLLPIVVRLRFDGVLVWSQTLHDLPQGFAWSLIEANDGSIVATGTTINQDGGVDGWVVRLGADGSRS